jgi:hypothetical protein
VERCVHKDVVILIFYKGGRVRNGPAFFFPEAFSIPRINP